MAFPPSFAAVAAKELFDVKIRLRVTIADSFHHCANVVEVVGKFAFVDIPAEQIAEYPPEILMAWERQETSAVRQF